MSLARQIVVTLLCSIIGLVVVAAVLVAMLEDGNITFETALPLSTMTAPMAGVIAFWVAGRALRVPLEPVRTFLYGALVVYGTLYFVGRAIVWTGVGQGVVLSLAAVIVLCASFLAVHAASGERLDS